MPYSLVTQPLPVPFKNPGTPSSTVAVQITRVLPSSINTLPSAVEIKSGVIFNGRIWSGPRPSTRTLPPAFIIFVKKPSKLSAQVRQFAGPRISCQSFRAKDEAGFVAGAAGGAAVGLSVAGVTGLFSVGGVAGATTGATSTPFVLN